MSLTRSAPRPIVPPSPAAPAVHLSVAQFAGLLSVPGVVVLRLKHGTTRVLTPWGEFEDDDALIALLLALVSANAPPALRRAP